MSWLENVKWICVECHCDRPDVVFTVSPGRTRLEYNDCHMCGCEEPPVVA